MPAPAYGTPAPAYGTPAPGHGVGPASAHGAVATPGHGTAPGRPLGPAEAPGGSSSRFGLWIVVGVVGLGVAALVYLAVRPKGSDDGERDQTGPVSTEFTTDPDRDVLPDLPPFPEDPPDLPEDVPDEPDEPEDEPDEPGDGATFRHPVHGYTIALPAGAGFAEVPTGDVSLSAFQGEVGGQPAVIMVGAGARDEMGDIDDEAIGQVVSQMAAQSGGTLVRTRRQKIQGKRRVTGIIDVPASGMRLEFVVFVGRSTAVMALFGASKARFSATAKLRADLFGRRIGLPD
jgi:hypothetical protein